MKIAYFGLPLGALLLERAGHDLALIALSPVEAPGRRRLQQRRGSRLLDFQAGNLAHQVETGLARAQPDLLLSWFWTRRFPRGWLEVPRLGAFGVHPSLLPRHRGPNPYFAAIDAGDVVTGVTLHRIEEQYDTGNIIAQRSVATGALNSWQLARALDRPGLELLLEAAQLAAEGRSLAGRPQDAAHATWAGEPADDQLGVRWPWLTERILRRIRALAPVPGLALQIGALRFFVLKAVASEPPALALRPGEAFIGPGTVQIRTGDAAIAIQQAMVAESETCVDGTGLANLLAERAPMRADVC